MLFPQIQNSITPHTIVPLPNSNGMQMLLCYDNEGVYVNTSGKVSRQNKFVRDKNLTVFRWSLCVDVEERGVAVG